MMVKKEFEPKLLTPHFDNNLNYTLKIGGTTYEVTSHFNTEGKQSILEQFKNLILSEKLI